MSSQFTITIVRNRHGFETKLHTKNGSADTINIGGITNTITEFCNLLELLDTGLMGVQPEETKPEEHSVKLL